MAGRRQLIAGALALVALGSAVQATAGAQGTPAPTYAERYAGGSLPTVFTGTRGGYSSAATSYVFVNARGAATSGRVTVGAYGYISCAGSPRYIHTTQLSQLSAGDASAPRTSRFTRTFNVAVKGARLSGSLVFDGTLTAAGGRGTLKLTGKLRRTGQRRASACKPSKVSWQVRPVITTTDTTPLTTLPADTMFYGGVVGAPDRDPDVFLLKSKPDGSGIRYGQVNVTATCSDGADYYEEWLFPGAPLGDDGTLAMSKAFPHERVEVNLLATASGLYGTAHTFTSVGGTNGKLTCDSGEVPVFAQR